MIRSGHGHLCLTGCGNSAPSCRVVGSSDHIDPIQSCAELRSVFAMPDATDCSRSDGAAELALKHRSQPRPTRDTIRYEMLF